MSVRIEKKLIAYESVSCKGIEGGLFFKPEVLEYLHAHPFPRNDIYSFEDMVIDLCDTDGLLTFHADMPENVIEYIRGLMQELI